MSQSFHWSAQTTVSDDVIKVFIFCVCVCVFSPSLAKLVTFQPLLMILPTQTEPTFYGGGVNLVLVCLVSFGMLGMSHQRPGSGRGRPPAVTTELTIHVAANREHTPGTASFVSPLSRIPWPQTTPLLRYRARLLCQVPHVSDSFPRNSKASCDSVVFISVQHSSANLSGFRTVLSLRFLIW